MASKEFPGLCAHGVLKTIRCLRCEEKVKQLKVEKVDAKQEPEMPSTPFTPSTPSTLPLVFTRIFLKNGQGFVDVPHVKATFQLAIYANLVKGCGGVMAESVFVPWDNILAILVFETENDIQMSTLGGGPQNKNEIN
jgi:hypothetical protein